MPWATHTELFMSIATINSPTEYFIANYIVYLSNSPCLYNHNKLSNRSFDSYFTYFCVKDIVMSSPSLCMQCNENYMKITFSFQAHEIEQITAIEGT